ncbi:MAG: sugar transferase [Clostridiales bacterium]|nr:sugar transferase [Clostridiales bacterium]
MLIKKWEDIPEHMKNDSVRDYYDILKKKQYSLLFKRLFDIVFSLLLMVLLLPFLLVIALAIKLDSKGPVLFHQERITQYEKTFNILKFRTMIDEHSLSENKVTVKNDIRITKVGKILRRYRLDEFPQLLNVFKGEMTFVGTRPEVLKYVSEYSDEMMATLLLPAGITSETSLDFKDEENLLMDSEHVDEDYLKKILPLKMTENLESLREYSFSKDMKVFFRSFIIVFFKNSK